MERQRFETLWRAFVEEQRRARAPEGLRERVEAAIRAAAAAGSGGEVPGTDAPGRVTAGRES